MLRRGHIMGEADITLGGGCLCRKNGSRCCSSGGDCSFRCFSAGGAVGTDRLDRYAVPPAAGWLLAPYLLWVSFTDYLNAGIWLLN